jgi:signal transduction histidine kinase
MTLFKQFKTWATGSDLIKPVQKSRVNMTVLTGVMLFLFLQAHIIVIQNLTQTFYGSNRDFRDSVLQTQGSFDEYLVFFTFIFFIFLLNVVWFALYKILKPVSDSIIARENFVANAHHELKTPLTIMKSEIDLFQTKNLSETQKNDLLGIQFQINRMIDLITDLLSQLSKKPTINKRSPIKIAKIIKHNIEQVKKIYTNSDAEVKIEGLDSVEILVNKTLFNQLILSIIENTFKHTQDQPNAVISIRLEKMGLVFENSTNAQGFIVGDGLNAIEAISSKLHILVEKQMKHNKFILILKIPNDLFTNL